MMRAAPRASGRRPQFTQRWVCAFRTMPSREASGAAGAEAPGERPSPGRRQVKFAFMNNGLSLEQQAADVWPELVTRCNDFQLRSSTARTLELPR